MADPRCRAIVTMVLSLSVHAVMLQGLHVPYPYNFPHTGWARLPDGILSALGAIYLSAQLRQSTRKHSIGFRCALLFLLLASIHEDLFRGPFMEFINLSNFTLYPFIDKIPKLIPWAVVALGVELWISHERSFRANLIAAALLAIVVGRFYRNRAILLFFALTARSWRAMRQTLNPVVAKVLKRLHYPLDVILLCVRWYSASVESSAAGGNDGRAWDFCRSLDRAPLGDQVVASPGEGVPGAPSVGSA